MAILELDWDLPLAIGSIKDLVDVELFLNVSTMSISAEGCLSQSIYTLRSFFSIASQVSSDPVPSGVLISSTKGSPVDRMTSQIPPVVKLFSSWRK